VFDLLRPYVVGSALYDSAKRTEEHAVTCQPETRDSILNDIRSWADSTTTTPVCWLSGPAGTGKTAVAHTIAEEYNKRKRLAATFFFWRKTGDRDDIDKVVATLAHQIATKVPSAQEQMEHALKLEAKSELPLPDLSLENQLSKFLVHGPVADTKHAGPNLIVIDGLDECASQEGVRRLIDWLRRNTTPFRFLLTSRPEPEIEVCFQPGDGRIDAWPLSLTESKDDIRRYFVKRLEEVWPREQRVVDGGPPEWPLELHLDKLVEKSEGLFVYAATAVRYIGGGDSPKMLLEDVLKLHKGLDPLYTQVIEVARERKHFDIVMAAIMHLRYSLTINELSVVLLTIDNGLDGPAVRFALAGCRSILNVPGDNTEIKSYHASLRDFLTNQSRSNILFYAPATSHGQLMVACLSTITRAFSDDTHAPEYALVSWYYHACLSLSAHGLSEGLGGLKDEAEELVKKINLKWVKVWMVEAVQLAGVSYLRGQLTQEKVRDWHMNLDIPH
jgi:DNA polymerase III delta prime subunit